MDEADVAGLVGAGAALVTGIADLPVDRMRSEVGGFGDVRRSRAGARVGRCDGVGHAVRGGEHDLRRDQRAGTETAVRRPDQADRGVAGVLLAALDGVVLLRIGGEAAAGGENSCKNAGSDSHPGTVNVSAA